MKSVQLLMRHWDDPDGYTQAVLEEFDWMRSERLVLDKLRKSKPLGVRDALVLKKNSNRMGMQIKLSDAARLMRHLR